MITLHTDFGDIKIALNFESAPKTAANFLEYAKNGFYEGTIFHRVIDGFMVQGGGMLPGMEEKSSNAQIENEADNGLSNKFGTLAMARTADPHSASSQFFINLKDNNFLDFTSKTSQGWGYCVFAEVVEGMDVIEKIKKVATGNTLGHGDVPLEDIIITKVTVEEA